MKLIIFGVRNFAEIAHYYFTHDSDFSVVGFAVDGEFMRETSFEGLPVAPFEDVTDHFPPSDCQMFVALGLHNMNQSRAEKVNEASAKGYSVASFLSSKAHVAPDFELRRNTMIMEHALLHPRVTVSENTMIWSTARIAWGSTIGNHCWLTTPATGERVTIGDNSFLGINCTIAPGVKVGKRNLIGAGAVITKNTEDGEVFRGAISHPAGVTSDQMKNF